MASYDYIEEAGLIIPDTSQTLAEVQAEFRAVFGDDLDVDPSTPQGTLIARIAEERDAIARNNAELANQINPDYANNVFLDAIYGLSGGTRRPAVKTIVTDVVLTGTPGTLVTRGAIAVTTSGDQFELMQQREIPASGTITGDFLALEAGPIEVEAGALNGIETSILGWTGVYNPMAGVTGRPAETDASVRRRRRNTLALQSVSTNLAVISGLYNIDTVRSLSYLENIESTTQVIEGITMKPNSIWVCVEGGSAEEIAQSLYDTKTLGAGYNGSIEVQVGDPRSRITHPVKFDRPIDVELLIRVTVAPSSLDLQQLIPDLVMRYVNQEIEGDVSFVVGSNVSPWEIAGAINQQRPEIRVRKVELSLVGSGTWSTDEYEIAINEIAKTQRSSITVVVE